MKKLINYYLQNTIIIITILLSLYLISCNEEEKISQYYTVMIESNGGTNYAPIKVREGDTIPKNKLYPSPIISDGGTFVCWCSDKELQNEYDFGTPVTKDMILYAKWFYVSYTITFNMNGAPEIPNKIVREGSKVDLDKPTYNGYIFVDWYEDAEYKKLFDPQTPIMKDVTLYARWVEPSPSSWFAIDSNGVLLGCNPPDGTSIITIPESVKVIPAWFVLANGLNAPGVPGFPTGKNIHEFILPDSLEEIGVGAFKFSGITSIKLPPKIKELHPTTFMGCDQLLSFTFAKGSQLERLNSNDLNEPVISSSSLETISFPPSLHYVGRYTLSGCTALKTVTFERSESPVIFYSYLPGGGVWLFGGYFPNKIRVPSAVKNSFISEMRKVMQDYEFDKMSSIVEGY